MDSIFKFKCNGTNYVDSGNANKNFYECKNLFAGSVHKTSSHSTMFKSLITFDLSNLQPHPISSAYLCVFVKDINSDTSYYSNDALSLYKNTCDFNVKSVTWNTLPPTNSPMHISITPNDVGKYIKINITYIVNSWIQDDKNYGITLEANNFYSSLVKLASANSSNPPWLLIKYKNYKDISDYNSNFKTIYQ